MEATQGRTGQAERTGDAPRAWTTTDELNWAADRHVLRDLKKLGEEPSEWLATEYRELNARRKVVAARG